MRILAWFSQHGRSFHWREPHATQYEIVIAELLLQRTHVAAVAGRLPDFLARLPTWRALQECPKAELEEILRPLGLWRRRASSLHALAVALSQTGGQIPTTRKEIEALPGVGQYVANAIVLFVLGRPAALLDVNMARVIERHFGPRTKADIRYDPWLQAICRAIVQNSQCARVNWGILDLAAKVCRTRHPLCADCPVARSCLFARRIRSRNSER
jgi:A/G-specific adenine glycosylase